MSMIIRPIASADFDAFHSMAIASGTGVTTLPDNREMLTEKIIFSEASFAKQVPPDHARYLFALEDTSTHTIVGVSGIEAAIGMNQVWYNYRLSNSVNACDELGIHQQTPTLYLNNDLTGATEVCTLFLTPEYRKNNNGLFLSLCRFLFMAEFPTFFHQKVFAEMRGVSDKQGRSPFWEALGQKFFQLNFSHADYLTGIGSKSFIAELMPKYPIYVPMLASEAQAVIAQVHPDTRPARVMLEREGFNFNGYIDIFDGGPALEAFQHNIRVVQQSFQRKVVISEGKSPVSESFTENRNQWYILTNGQFQNFRLALIQGGTISRDEVIISGDCAEKLAIQGGEIVRIASLRERSRDAS